MLKLSGRSKISLLVWLASKDHKSAGWRLVYCVMAVLTSQIALARLKIPWTHCSPIPETLWSPIPISCSIGIGMFVRACTNELWPHRVINSLPSHVCHYNTLATPTWNVTSAYHIGPLSSGPSCQMIRCHEAVSSLLMYHVLLLAVQKARWGYTHLPRIPPKFPCLSSQMHDMNKNKKH